MAVETAYRVEVLREVPLKQVLEIREIVDRLDKELRGFVAKWVIEDLERIRYLTSQYIDGKKED